MTLVDVVNFNADASCLSSAKWLHCLEDQADSLLMRMLSQYVQHGRKVNLGLIASTVLDIEQFNPGAIRFINAHPEVFEIVLRPFTHDSPLLRLPDAFRFNVQEGIRCLRSRFERVNNFYLAPEVMVTGEQVRILEQLGIQGTFIHRGRFRDGIQRVIPDSPFVVRGILQSRMLCLPFASPDLEKARLTVLHGVMRPDAWCEAARRRSGFIHLWHDGESCLLLPMSLEYEGQLFEAEASCGLERLFLSELPAESPGRKAAPRYFPMHSLKPWMDEMKLYWYISRVRDIERLFDSLSEEERLLWLLTINSDILSSVEKDEPHLDVSDEVLAFDRDHFLWDGVVRCDGGGNVILTRSERAGEGEEYLAFLDLVRSGEQSLGALLPSWQESGEPHLLKAHARLQRNLTTPHGGTSAQNRASVAN